MLRPAADRGEDLLGVGRGQDEDDVAGRLLQGLQQGVGRRRREHVDLVDDVDLPAPGVPRAAWDTRSRMASTPLFEAASSSCTSSDVPRAISTQESQTPHGSPSSGRRAVERLGQNAGRRGLARPRGPLKR